MYAALHDASRCTSDKVKLVRYAWMEDSLHWPNKEQELLDWLSSTLGHTKLDRRNLSEADCQSLLKCLHDILHRRKCHEPTTTGQPLMLHPELLKRVLLELEKHAQGSAPGSCEDVIVSSCLRILLSPVFGHQWASKIHLMSKLMLHSTKLCSQAVSKRRLTDKHVQLLHTSAQSYNSASQQSSFPRHVFQYSKNLITPVAELCLSATNYQGDFREELLRTSREVMDGILKGLVQREFSSYFERFLMLKVSKVESSAAKTTPSKELSAPKFLEVFYGQTFENLLVSTSVDAVELTSALFSKFVQNFRGSPMSFQMCQFVLDLADVVAAKQDDKKQTERESLSTVRKMELVHKLLRIVDEENLYDQAEDHLKNNPQLAWLRRLYGWVAAIDAKERTADWYSIQRTLISLNHSTVKPTFDKFLQSTWLQAGEIPVEHEEQQGQLLCEVIELYTKLRQLPTLVKKICDGLIGGSIKWPAKIVESFSKSIVSQAPTVVIEIWEYLVKEFLEFHMQDESSAPAREFICRLLSLFMLHGRLADSMVTQQMSASMWELMRKTRDEILKPFLQGSTSKRPDTEPFLHLAHSWGQLHMTLLQYSTYYQRRLQSADTQTDSETCLGLIWSETLEKMFTKATKRNRASAIIILMKLRIQSFKWLLLRLSGDLETSHVHSVVNLLFLNLTGGGEEEEEAIDEAWNEQDLDLSMSLLPVAVWRELCQVLPLVDGYMTETHRQMFAQHFVRSLEQGCTKKISKTTVTQCFLKNGALWELPSVMSAILCEMWKHIASEMTSSELVTPKRKKKKRNSEALNDSAQLMVQLVENKGKQSLYGLCEPIASTLESCTKVDRNPTNNESIIKISNVLKVVRQLPLEHIPESDREMCLLAMLALLSWKPLALGPHDLVQCLLDQLNVLFGNDQSKALQHLNLATLLKWTWQSLGDKQLPTGLVDIGLELYSTVISKVLSTPDRMDSVTDHIKQVLCEVAEDADDEWSSQLLLLWARDINKKMRKSSPDHLKELHDLIEPYSLKLVTRLDTDVPPCSPELQGLGLQMYRSQILYCLRENSDLSTLEKHLPNVTAKCLELLRTNQVENVQQGCLFFVYTLLSSKKKLPVTEKGNQSTENDADPPSAVDTLLLSVLPSGADFHSEAWDALLSLLCSDSQLPEEIKFRVNGCLTALLSVASAEKRGGWIHQLLDDMVCERALIHPEKCVTSLDVWNLMLDLRSEQNWLKDLTKAAPKLILQLQQLLCEAGRCWKPKYQTLIVRAVDVQTRMLSWGESKMPAEVTSLVLHSASYVPLDDLDIAVFSDLFLATLRLLHDLLVHHKGTVCDRRIPAYCLLVRRCLTAIVGRGRQPEEGSTSDGDVNLLLVCAQQMASLLELISSHKKDFSKVAAYIVSDFSVEAHKVTLIPLVKRALMLGVHACLDICDKHQVALLHAALPLGVMEMYGRLYTEYEAYHKYRGRV